MLEHFSASFGNVIRNSCRLRTNRIKKKLKKTELKKQGGKQGNVIRNSCRLKKKTEFKKKRRETRQDSKDKISKKKDGI